MMLCYREKALLISSLNSSALESHVKAITRDKKEKHASEDMHICMNIMLICVRVCSVLNISAL